MRFDTKSIPHEDLVVFLQYVKKNRGLDLSSYRKTFLERRLRARFGMIDIDTVTKYIAVLETDSDEWINFIDSLSINVSKFFRDIAVYEFFEKNCIPQLIESKYGAVEKTIRCWSCGCSCGEEAYSIALMFQNYFKKKKEEFKVKVWATDIDKDALSSAAKGEYEMKTLEDVDPKILKDYFELLKPGYYQIKDEVKDIVFLKELNVFHKIPFEHLDVVFFRNVRIYFETDKVDDIVLKLCSSLKKGGFLVLGKTESLSNYIRNKNVLETVDISNRIFKKL